MMMAVDESGQYNVLLGTESLICPMFCSQFSVRTDFDDHAVALENRSVVHHRRSVTASHFADDILAADERRGHGFSSS